MDVQGEGRATAAAAEQLVAEEASEAAKAAAKKAKKQKAKARKQQAHSDAITAQQPSASQPSASPPLDSESSASQPSASQTSNSPSSASQTSGSRSSAESVLQAQQHMQLMATRHHSSPSESSGDGASPDHNTDGMQAQLQRRTAHDSAVHVFPVYPVLDEQASTSGASVDGLPAAKVPAADASREADADFLDQLFCCPITKVPLALHPPTPLSAPPQDNL